MQPVMQPKFLYLQIWASDHYNEFGTSAVKTAPRIVDRDRSLILDVVRRFGAISRTDIHRLTHLRLATISQLSRELLNDGKLLEGGPGDNRAGSGQKLLRVNEEFGYVVGVDYDAEFTMAAVMDLHPRIKKPVVKEPSYLEGGSEGLLRQLFRCTRQAINQAGTPFTAILGIGVGDPGLVDKQQALSVMSSTIDFWREVPVQELFVKEFGIPTAFENNGRTRAIAERLMGAGEQAPDMIHIEYGKGIGAGIIIEGRPFRGHRSGAGEFGHTHIIENGPACKCGSFGCLEALAGIGALESRIRRAISEGGHSLCLAMAGDDPQRISGWMVLDAARQGDKMAVALVDEIGRYLGLGIANLVNLFNPSIIVLDQRLESAGERLLDQIKRIVNCQALAHLTEGLRFRFGKLGGDANLLGAGLLALEELFEVPALKPPRFIIDPTIAPLGPRRRNKRQTQTESPPTVMTD
jgi:N-acetylglucosamine repressor